MFRAVQVAGTLDVSQATFVLPSLGLPGAQLLPLVQGDTLFFVVSVPEASVGALLVVAGVMMRRRRTFRDT